MSGTLRRLGWIFLLVVAAIYGTYLLGSNFNANIAGHPTPLTVRDELSSGQHHLTGSVFVASTCEQLAVTAKQIAANTYRLDFETWPDPSVRCDRGAVSRGFDIVVFAPSVGTHFTATLDKNPLQIAVYPTIK